MAEQALLVTAFELLQSRRKRVHLVEGRRVSAEGYAMPLGRCVPGFDEALDVVSSMIGAPALARLMVRLWCTRCFESTRSRQRLMTAVSLLVVRQVMVGTMSFLVVSEP